MGVLLVRAGLGFDLGGNSTDGERINGWWRTPAQKQAWPTLKVAHLLNRSHGLGCATLSKLRNKTGNRECGSPLFSMQFGIGVTGFVS
jgi:hypothetical protein